MGITPLSMPALLEQANFVLRGATRADCIYCHGHSRGTVAFTSELAFCHRCKWRANSVTLARELGLSPGNLPTASTVAATRRRQKVESQIRRFELWREDQIRRVSERYQSLSRAAMRATQVLTKFPDSEEAWSALARFYHAEAGLSAILDWLMFMKASNWLEADSTPTEVFQMWENYAA